MTDITLELRPVQSIEGTFLVPSYQRGYRWGREEVTRLLDDLMENHDKNYCLQPIVVAHREDGSYELIDGQQRLTTIYLIRKCIYESAKNFFEAPRFSVRYQTREQSEAFLKQIDFSKRDENIDFYFMSQAYETIQDWFAAQKVKSTAVKYIDEALAENVSVIWYEVREHDEEDAIRMFERLNIGRIPLTSAELVKAMFLSAASKGDLSENRQGEIALQWDEMERALHKKSFWAFLCNDTSDSYRTRIDLVLDLISGKTAEDKEQYRTFFYFMKMREEGKELRDLWEEIYTTFLLLVDWYEDEGDEEDEEDEKNKDDLEKNQNKNAFYHKIGYLIASKTETLSSIYQASKGKGKQAFREVLDDMIRKSVQLADGKNYGDLSYEKSEDRKKISRLLLLFNVESVRRTGTERFPFDKFKQKGEWTLEHIHAQQSDGMVKNEKVWREWLKLHLESVQALGDENLKEEMNQVLAAKTLSGDVFEGLRQKVMTLLSDTADTGYIHSIANLALLNAGDNAALSNAAFDAKRNQVIDMDKRGEYIPYCTKMVFLKYYTPSNKTDLHFWGETDRKYYIEMMNNVLKPFLQKNKIVLYGGVRHGDKSAKL